MRSHVLGQVCPWPQNPFFGDFIEEPVAEAVRQYPFDPIASPEDAHLLDIHFGQTMEIVAGALNIALANRQSPHPGEPLLDVGMLHCGEGHDKRGRTGHMRKQRNVGDR